MLIFLCILDDGVAGFGGAHNFSRQDAEEIFKQFFGSGGQSLIEFLCQLEFMCTLISYPFGHV